MTATERGLLPSKGSMLGISEPRTKSKNISAFTVQVHFYPLLKQWPQYMKHASFPLIRRRLRTGVIPLRAYPAAYFHLSIPTDLQEMLSSQLNNGLLTLNSIGYIASCLIFFLVRPCFRKILHSVGSDTFTPDVACMYWQTSLRHIYQAGVIPIL